MPNRISDVMETHSPKWLTEFIQKLQMDVVIARLAVYDQEKNIKSRFPYDEVKAFAILFDNPGYHMSDVASEVLSEIDSADISKEWSEVSSVMSEITWSPEAVKGYISTSKIFDQHFGSSSPLIERLRHQIKNHQSDNSRCNSYEEVLAAGLVCGNISQGYHNSIELARMRYGDICASIYARVSQLVQMNKAKNIELRDELWKNNIKIFQDSVVSLSKKGNYVSSFAAESIVLYGRDKINARTDINENFYRNVLSEYNDTYPLVHCPKEIGIELRSHMIDSNFLHDLHDKERITGKEFKDAIDINGLDINELLGEVYFRCTGLGDKISDMLDQSGINANPLTYEPPRSTTEVVVNAKQNKQKANDKMKEISGKEEISKTKSYKAVKNSFNPDEYSPS